MKIQKSSGQEKSLKTGKKRNFQKFLSILLFASAFFADCAYCSMERTKFSRIDDIFAKYDNTRSPGCALAVIKDGKIIKERCYGMSNLDHEITIKPNTVFRIGSLSKQFTSASLLILHKMGKLSLDDDIRKYVPEMPEYEWTITVRHLVHHMSGIREYEMLQDLKGELTDQGYHNNETILELIKRQKGLDFRPGERCQYSNSGYTLLSIIVERVSGKTLGQFAKKHIFDPLGMRNTFILEDNTDVVKNRATGYSPESAGFAVNETLNESTGDGAVFTTIHDFFLWDQNFYNNKIDGVDFIEDMLETGTLNDGSDATLGRGQMKYGYASGLVVSKYRGLRTVGHGGSFVGFRAGYLLFPENNFSVIILANTTDIFPVGLCYEIADIFLENDFLEEKPDEEHRPEQKKEELVSLPAHSLDEYTGKYYGDELQAAYEIEARDGKLYFVHKNAVSDEPLKCTAQDTFRYWALELRFIRKKDKIIGFINQSDYVKGMFFKKLRQTGIQE